MAKDNTENFELRTGEEAGILGGDLPPVEDTADNAEENSPKKSFSEYTIHDSETARERGRNGGVRSGEVRRAKRDARESIQYLLGRVAKSDAVRNNLKDLGAEESELSNMLALQGRLFTMAISGNLEAYMTLMRMGGYDPEETRKERESVNADRRKNMETESRLQALESGVLGRQSMSVTDSDDGDSVEDVYILLPDNGRDQHLQKQWTGGKENGADHEVEGKADTDVTTE